MLAPRPRYIDRRLRSTRAGRASSLPRMIECGLRPLAGLGVTSRILRRRRLTAGRESAAVA
jgi:hypothetical protein